MTIKIVNFSREMFNDSLYFLEQAKQYDHTLQYDWCRWRYLRAAILYSIACVESVVNRLILINAKARGNKKIVKKIQNRPLGIKKKVENTYPSMIGKKWILTVKNGNCLIILENYVIK